jgi:hypothetical protein
VAESRLRRDQWQRSHLRIYHGKWNELQHGKLGGPGLAPLQIPPEFYVWPGSPRDPSVGDPLVSFRWDQAVEFVNAIREHRDCAITFHDGARAQGVMSAAVESAQTRAWIDLPTFDPIRYGTTAVITGAGSGVGQATALSMAKLGWNIAIIGRRKETLDETLKHAGEFASRLTPYVCDIGNAGAVAQTGKSILEKFGPSTCS